MRSTNRKRTLAPAVVTASILALLGVLVEAGQNGVTPYSAKAAEPGLHFVQWKHPSGLMSAEVPAGWKIDGAIGPALDLGQFKIQGFSPDGRCLFSVGHNWLSFMEFLHGQYRPGRATTEDIVLPQFLKQHRGYTGVRIVYRSRNQRVIVWDPITRMGIPFDRGTLGFLLERRDGSFSAGTAFAETMYISSPGTPGLWRLRLFMAAVGPADRHSQRKMRTVLERVAGSLALSKRFFVLWHQANARTMQQMRAYSSQMKRVFDHYLTSAGRSSSKSGRDPLAGWATMMRGGQYAEDKATGDQYWISNERDYWFVNDRGDVVGNDTGEVPTNGGNWRPLRPIGP